MKKHIEALEARRTYLASKLNGAAPVLSKEFLSVFREEKEALDWALGKLEADPEPVEYNKAGVAVKRHGRDVKPIGNTGHYGPIREGATVQALADVKHAGIYTGEIGTLTKFDRWAGEEFPYIATFADGRKAAFAREDIRRVD